MRVIITGAGGLLGRGLAAAARRAGYETLGIGRTAAPPANLACDHWLAADLAEQAIAQRDWSAFRGAHVFHLAGETRVYDSGRDFARANLATTAAACAIASRTGGRLVYFSSSAVYSGPRTRRPVQRLLETDETEPVGAYGRSKQAAEELIRRSGCDAVILRLFGVLSVRLAGSTDRGNLVQAIIRALRTGEEVVIATDEQGEPMIRDYVLEEDVCQCALASLDWIQPSEGSLTVNLCTGEPTSTEDMVEIAAAAGRAVIPQRRQQPRSDQINPIMLGDPSLLRKLLGNVPGNRVEEFWAKLLSGPEPAR
jgi:nucleoside-diphosphate-sugar epimerase